MSDFTEVKSASELNSTPPKFQSAVSGVVAPSADEEAQMKAMFQGVTMENLDEPVKQAAPQGQPPAQSVPPAAVPVAEAPKKFLRPDGTVDEEKLKTSSEQFGKAIEQKQKTVDEMLAEYRDKEKQFTELGTKAKQLKETQAPSPASDTQQAFPQVNPNQSPEQIRAQLLQLQQDDPIGFAVEIAKVVARKEAQEIALPALQVTARLAEQERDSTMRQNLVQLAEKDSRVQDPALYAELITELNSDPAYFRLKNPVKSAWNEVKERLRLGEPQGSAQSSQTPGPTLGRGAPPSVSSLPQPMSQQTVRDRIYDSKLNPSSAEGKQLEESMLRQLAENTWRG